jgi:hypothetical protein
MSLKVYNNAASQNRDKAIATIFVGPCISNTFKPTPYKTVYDSDSIADTNSWTIA